MLPRAIEVSAIDDCTVDGSAARKKTPVHNAGGNAPASAFDMASASSGNITKVLVRITRCNRQWVIPSAIEARDSFAPTKKNSSTTIAIESTATPCAATPVAGRTVASSSAATSPRINGSGTSRRSMENS